MREDGDGGYIVIGNPADPKIKEVVNAYAKAGIKLAVRGFFTGGIVKGPIPEMIPRWYRDPQFKFLSHVEVSCLDGSVDAIYLLDEILQFYPDFEAFIFGWYKAVLMYWENIK